MTASVSALYCAFVLHETNAQVSLKKIADLVVCEDRCCYYSNVESKKDEDC